MNREIEFDLLLKLHRESLSIKVRNRDVLPVSTLYPIATEQWYASEISALQKKIVVIALNKVNVYLKQWMAKPINTDSYDEDFERFLQEMEDEIIALYGVTFLWDNGTVDMISRVAQRVFSFENNQWEKQTNHVLGMSWKSMAEWWPGTQKTWAINNYNLVKDLSREYINKLTTLIITAIQSRWGYPELVESILKLSDKFTGYRTRLIARNQVGFLNSFIWREQYNEIGLSTYIWTTAHDEKVRGTPGGKYPKSIPSHYVMDGLLVDWNNPGVYSKDGGKTWIAKSGIMEFLQVGQANGCRCVPKPYWKNKIEKVDKQLEGTI